MDRKALLDLGTRNRLVNIPLRTKNIRAIEIIDEKSSEVFRLLGESKRFTFLAAKAEAIEGQPPSVPDDESSGSIAQQFHVGDGDETGSRARHSDRRLQTKLSPEGLQNRLLNIWYDARTLEEEQGVNILYFAFGLLKWFEDDKSDVERFAPLVLLPVRIERSSAADRFHLASRAEPPSTNLSLQAKMDGEFGIKIEDFGDEDDVDIAAYISGVAETVSGKSQTITNIIASAAAEGRTVLFVAEKMAALDVVHRRLRDAGLASLALELHSSKANKRVLLEELKRTRSAAA